MAIEQNVPRPYRPRVGGLAHCLLSVHFWGTLGAGRRWVDPKSPSLAGHTTSEERSYPPLLPLPSGIRRRMEAGGRLWGLT
jgi:hypothetical protein